MTLKPKDPITGARSGAFMREAGLQSQPRPPAKAQPQGPNCHYPEPVTQAGP